MNRQIIYTLLLISLLGASNSAFAAAITIIDTPTFNGAETEKAGPWSPTLGSIRPYDSSNNIALGGATVVSSNLNLPAVYDEIHDDANLVDGFYGNGSSWIPGSANSWFKIDLGSNYLLDSLTFGRDRLGNFNDRDPGAFTISTALIDTYFADSNTTNDGT